MVIGPVTAVELVEVTMIVEVLLMPRVSTMVSKARIVRAVNVSVESVAVMPGTSANENPVGEPFGSVITVRSALIRCVTVVTIRADGRGSNTDAD